MLLLLACTGAPPAEPTAEEQVHALPNALAIASTHLPTVAADLAQRFPEHTDRSETFFATPIASAHMHLIGKDQLCPLHIHRTTNEATIIVTGEPDVLQIWGPDQERSEDRFGPGTLVASPPFTGHEWDNNSPLHQANLVLAYPSFDGNLYLREGDPRMDAGTEPFAYHPSEDLGAFVDSGAPSDARELPALAGRMTRVLVATQHVLEASDESHAIVYAAGGRGALDAGEVHRDIEPGTLLVFQRSEPVTFSATEPLALYVFTPPIKE